MPLSLKERINKLLLDKKLISAKNLAAAIDIQKEVGGKLSDILIERGFVDKKDLMVVLSQELGIPPINLSRYRIDTSLVKLIPRKFAERYKIMPISKMGNLLTVAMADPLNIFAIDEIKTLTGFQIGILIATDKDIESAIDQYYGEATHHAIEEIMEGMEKGGSVEMVEDGMGQQMAQPSDLMRLTQETPVVKITNLILTEAVYMKASDVLIEPMERTLRVRYRIDGILHEAKTPPRSMHEAIISRLKVMSNLNIAERRLPQDGRFKIRIQNREVDFRISVLPSNIGEKAALRILDKNQAMLDLEKLGFEGEPLRQLRDAARKPHGMILVCGPTGCGKTTTLYSILKYIDTPESNIITVEDPVEYDLAGINQVTVRPEIGLTFASSLRSILRQDPDVIMVGEIRDYDTADIAIKAALTGHLVLSTLHTTTSSGSIIRLVNMGIEPFLITSSVILVAAQRLARRICPNCKEEYKVKRSLFAGCNLERGKDTYTLYKGRGCESCFNTGYKGRVGLIETLALTPKVRELIVNKAQEYQVRDTARREGMATLRENGLKKALAGITTWEEVLRLTAGDQDLDTV
ncbi:MAG: Flp pilus assembly complex ATPase component TadA [Candidatus Omnitrophica bacterium]|nr:Flp pilus assembly complex ATPase component TadA [Candidatus Omnitrophota bacterium]